MFSARVLRNSIIGLAACAACATASAGETIEYSGRVYAERAADLLPLGNGTGVMNVQVAGVTAMSGNPPILFTTQCAGLGLVDTEGKAVSDVYCTFQETEADAFDIKGKFSEGEGEMEVIGGSGRFAGATGSGNFLRADKAGGPGTGIINIKVNTK